MGMRPPPELLAAASLATSPPGAAAQLASSAVVPDASAGRPTWNTTMGYEQLLSIQQHQHALAMQHKEAEVAHMKACIDMMQVGQSSDSKHVSAVLQTKDEEAALMMAAKHKELELMAGLLQLREQQIEDFRQLCEAQRLDIQQLKRRRAVPDAGVAPAIPDSNAGREQPAVPESPVAANLAFTDGARDARRDGTPKAQEEHSHLQREVRRLRLRMEELEAAVGEQHERSAGLARALEAKSERVKALEEHVRSLHSPVTWADSEQDSGLGGGTEPTALPASLRPSPPRLLLPPNHHAPVQEHDRHAARSCVTARSSEGDGGGLLRSGTSVGSAQAESVPPLPPLPQLGGADGYRHQDWQTSLANAEEASALRSLAASTGSLPQAGRPLSAGRMRLSAAASDEPGDASLPSGHQTYRSAVHVDCTNSADGPEGLWSGASEAAETGRQSQELLREMRRLRLQMSELERVAGTRHARGPSASSSTKQLRGGAGGHDRLLASASSFGGESSGDANGTCGAGMEPAADYASADRGHRQAHPALPAAAAGHSMTNGHSWPWSRHASEGALRSAGGSGASSSVAGRSVRSEDHGMSEIAAGWEYRPHSSGDPVDAAVATLVNRPGGRYRGWRALLCRLERGVYLCGTRRVRLRADVALDRIEASDDGGKTWSDLEELMRGAEASQHALLERARDAAGLAA